MNLIELHPVLMTAWVLWFFLLFGGICTRALWPGRRERFERARMMPLREME
jgi:cytochrome c oxidase cbb3-type subunit 4